MPTSTACPQCQHSLREPEHHFCTHCGLALKQPCPHCSAKLSTPADPFVSCQSCNHDFWSCQSCGRLYHLDRTSCQNSYCPEKGRFWTTRFGCDEFYQTQNERTIARSAPFDESPRPGWAGGATAAADIRWPSLHTLGLLLSVQESGVVELWGERGAPHSTVGDDFGERSVCLTRLDLGEESPCPPFYWNKQIIIPGTSCISVLDMTSSPSLGQRYPVDEIGRPKHFAQLRKSLLCWGSQGLGELSEDGAMNILGEDGPANSGSFIITDGQDKALIYSPGNEPVVWSKSEDLFQNFNWDSVFENVDYALYADRMVLIAGNRLAYLKGNEFEVVDLPASVIAEPLYSEPDNRLTLLLNDGSARSCSPTGEKFSFVCDLAGTPSTCPLQIGEGIFYGTEGRYLCRAEEAIRPRLSSPPMGALSYANGRIFGNLRDGSLFCFEL
jgi:Double zinc ribbon